MKISLSVYTRVIWSCYLGFAAFIHIRLINMLTERNI